MSNPSSTEEQSLLSGYQAPPGVFDEIFQDSALTRDHWRPFLEEMKRLGVEEFSKRWSQALRLVHENGITYRAYGDSHGVTRPWDLNAIPLLISAQEMSTIQEGLAQRARLLNAILHDVYGKQTLLKQGLIPAQIVFNHPDYSRSLQDVCAADSQFLQLYAADVARSPAGTWLVMGDRTEVPTGMGYALENRMIISRMLPSTILNSKVRRLAPFYISLQKTLRRLAIKNQDNPRVVVFSQGPTNPNYFEDVYLARYLGFTLVTGEDLTVRNNEVKLKTLGGLLHVDVIFRRTPDSLCDPLELDSSSRAGVAGLLEAIRAKNVAVLNCPGSSLVESPVFLPFLAKLSQHILGEDLELPSLTTYWCGNPEDCDHVLNNLDNYIIKPAYRGRFGAKLSQEIKNQNPNELIAKITQFPEHYVAQENLNRSVSAVWNDNNVLAKSVALRTYLLSNIDNYVPMPGGLCRLGKSSNELLLSISAGEASADVWEVSDQPVKNISLLTDQGHMMGVRRAGNELPSRVADHFYWLGRNIERAEQGARLLRTIINRLAVETRYSLIPELDLLWKRYADYVGLPKEAAQDFSDNHIEFKYQAISDSVLNRDLPGSLFSSIKQIHRLSAIIQDRLSFDSWRIIHRLNQLVEQQQSNKQLKLSDVSELLNLSLEGLAAVSGLIAESMTRSQAWRFLELGRRIERSTLMTKLVRVYLDDLRDSESQLLESSSEAILEVSESLMTYRSRYLVNLQPGPLLDLIVLDEVNPRSVLFQLGQILKQIKKLPSFDKSIDFYSPEERICNSMIHTLKSFDPDLFETIQQKKVNQEFDAILKEIEKLLVQLSDVISHRYLVHTDIPRALDLFQIGAQ